MGPSVNGFFSDVLLCDGSFCEGSISDGPYIGGPHVHFTVFQITASPV